MARSPKHKRRAPAEPAPGAPRWSPRALGLALGALALTVAAVRCWEVAALPLFTGDVVRNVLYGVAVRELGLAAAGRPLVAISTSLAAVSWSQLPYNYPPLALAFFTAVSALSPTVFAAKLALTFVELGNGVLIGRLCQSRALGVLYWASPASIWWVSREGQFEPLQNLFTLLALLALPGAPLLAGAALALAVQVKLTALALAPWLLYTAAKRGPGALRRALLGLALGFIPGVFAELAYGAFSHVFGFSSPLSYNPYYWNLGARMSSWNPSWLVASDQLASYGLLLALASYALRAQSAWSVAAPVVFTLFCKLHTNVQFWYFLLLAPLLVPIEDRRWRFALIAAVPLLDVSSALSLFGLPVGLHGYRGLDSVFAAYRLPGS